MKLYCDDKIVIAIHSDNENVPLETYGSATDIIVVDNDYELEKFGTKPKKNELDTRLFYKRPSPPLDQLKLNALTLIDQGHAAILRQLTGNATIEERDTWQSKALAAYAISEGNANSYQNDMISTEAVMSGIEVSELVTKILSRNAAFMKMIGIAAGHRTATRAAINKASSVQELKNVLSSSEEKANELIQSYLMAIQNGG